MNKTINDGINLLSEIHFWTNRDDVIVKNTNFGTFIYSNKKEFNDNALYNSKRSYCERRGVVRNLGHKLKDKLKELEEHLAQNKVICGLWEVDRLQLLLSKGLLVNISLNANSVITGISFDKTLSTKLQTELICDGAIFRQQIACVCTDGNIICQGGIWKDGWVIEGSSKKKITLQEELLCVWGRVNVEHPQPWSPFTKDHQKANLILYWVGPTGPELQAYKTTEGEPVEIIISKVQHNYLIVIEQKVSVKGVVCIEVNTLELVGNTLNRISITSVPLQTQVSCCALSRNETRLLLGCIDGSIALLDRNRGSTYTVKTSIIPTFAVWHRCGVIAAISNEKGQLQYFDTALNRVNTRLIGEDSTPVGLLDLSNYFNIQITATSILWGPRNVIVILDHGPLILVTHLETSLNFISLIQQYLNAGKAKKAIALLLSWQWNDQCFIALQRIFIHLLKSPLTEENALDVQNTLCSFHNSPVPLSASVKHKYGFQIQSLTRRFFHQLVRHKMFETAFLLAVDIGHHDLFMDLYYCAVNIGEKEMAAAARAQASALVSRCSSETSCCSHSSCSDCSDSCTESSTTDNNQQDSPVKPTTLGFSMSTTTNSYNDNFLTTNFNDVNPKTYQTQLTDIYRNNVSPVTNIGLPKAVLPLRPNIYKSLSTHHLPSSTMPVNPVLEPPPLPVAPVIPSMSRFINKNYSSQFGSMSSSASFTNIISPPLVPYIVRQTSILDGNRRWNTSEIDLRFNSELKMNSSNQGQHAPTVTSPSMPLSQNSLLASSVSLATTNTTGVKKQQAKVKFSDTVTAFIVPEIKRAVRPPPPPPHIADPQKELADSLPLCHPNEDYLKDFTPANRAENEEVPSQSKIKVVHFGIV